jgi:hypothetical protein
VVGAVGPEGDDLGEGGGEDEGGEEEAHLGRRYHRRGEGGLDVAAKQVRLLPYP